jgi:hypothetical protein
MQGIAWAKMLVSYTAAQGVRCGMEFTFDSEHPCPLCHKIDEANNRDKEPKSLPSTPVVTSLKWAAPIAIISIPAISEELLAMVPYGQEPPCGNSEGRSAPPKPPPRAVPHLLASNSPSTAALFP